MNLNTPAQNTLKRFRTEAENIYKECVSSLQKLINKLNEILESSNISLVLNVECSEESIPLIGKITKDESAHDKSVHDKLELHKKIEEYQKDLDDIEAAWEYINKIILPNGIGGPIEDFSKFYEYISTFTINLKKPSRTMMLSRIIGIAIKATIASIDKNDETFPYVTFLQHLDTIFTDNGTISPDMEDEIGYCSAVLTIVLFPNSKEKDDKAASNINDCKQLLEFAIKNYKDDLEDEKQQQDAALKTALAAAKASSFGFEGVFSAEQSKFISMFNECFDERTGTVIKLPSCSCHEFINRLMSMPDDIYDSRKKKQIKIQFLADVKKHLNNLMILYYLNEDDRIIYKIISLINEQMPENNDSDCSINIILPDEFGLFDANMCLCLTKNERNFLKMYLDELNCANDYISDSTDKDRDETFSVIAEDIKKHIAYLKALLESKGITFDSLKSSTPKPKMNRAN